MEEKKECNIVQDLFPSYIEKLTDEKTNEFVEEHIKSCDSCSEKLEYMQNNIEIDSPKKEDKEVKFLKKYKTKLRIFQYIVLVILLSFVFVVGRRYIILTNLENKARNTINENNYYIKTVSQSVRMYIWESSFSPNPKDSITNASRIEISEEYYKNGTKLSHSYYYQLNDKGDEISQISLDGETYFRNNRIVIHIPRNALKKYEKDNSLSKNKPAQISLSLSTHSNGLITPVTESLSERLSKAFTSEIKKIKFAGRNCYVIKIANGAIENYIDVETGLRIKTINNEYNYSKEYYYSFGTVTDADVEEPDLSEYVVLDNREEIKSIVENSDNYIEDEKQ